MIKKLLTNLENTLKLEEDKLISIIDEVYYPISPDTHLFRSSEKLKYQIRDIGYILDDEYVRGEFDKIKKKYLRRSAKIFYDASLDTKSYIQKVEKMLLDIKNDNK